MLDLLVKNGMVLTMADGCAGFIRCGAVGIAGNTIACVGESEEISRQYRAKETIDARGRIIMPGLVNAHAHTTTGLPKGILVNIVNYLYEGLAGYNEHITPESQIASCKLSLLEGIKRGYTTYCDTNFGSSIIAHVHEEFGTRCRISELVRELPYEITDREKGYTFSRDYGQRYVEASRELLKRYGTDPNSRISAMVAMQGLDYCSEELILTLRDLGRESGAMFHTHIGQSREEMKQCHLRWGKSPVGVFDELGMLNANTIGAHMTELSKEDVIKAARSGVPLLTTPTSYYTWGSISPIALYDWAGGTVAVGSDECSAGCINPFVEMRVTLNHAAMGAALSGLEPLKVLKILQMSTIESAKAIGLGDQVGSLEVGKRADIIIVNPFTVTMLPLVVDPMINFINDLVTSCTGDEVDTVIIDGRVVVLDKVAQTFDERAVFEEVQYEGQKANEKAYEYYKTLPDSEVLKIQASYHKK